MTRALSSERVPPACVLAEFLGTLLFQFFGGACSSTAVSNGPIRVCSLLGLLIVSSGLTVAALGNGVCLAVLVYSTAGISGGHLNPAVSLGFWVNGRLGKMRFMLYVAAQLLGAIAGAVMLRICLPPTFLGHPFVTQGYDVFSSFASLDHQC
eukprot:99919-Hanusia_phi.AAC.1